MMRLPISINRINIARSRPRLRSPVSCVGWLTPLICLFLSYAPITSLPAFGADETAGSGLRQLGNDFAQVYRTASRAVVHVHSRSASGNTSDGSGVVFAPASARTSNRHYILTSHHVIDGSERTTVRLSDGREFRANITGSDSKTDIAILDIPAASLSPLQSADSDQVQIGQWVLAIGSPYGLKHSLTAGIVSGTGRTNLGINAYEDYIQTDAAFSPGNSGGPLINLNGEIVGIISAVFAGRDGFTGTGFAIPINLARSVANQLVANGEVNRAYLGVFLQSMNASLAQAFGVNDTRGALVSEVAPDSPADQAGLQIGDLIIRYRGKPVRDAGQFINDLSLTTPDTRIKLTIIRQGIRQTLNATVAARQAYEPTRDRIDTTPAASLHGMTISPLTSELALTFNLSVHDSRIGNGLIITAVEPGSPAAINGVEPGGLLLRIGNQTVNNLEQLRHHAKRNNRSKDTLMLIRQDGAQEFIVFENKSAEEL